MTQMEALTHQMQRIGVPDRLVIAAGTAYATHVRDARQLFAWSRSSGVSADRARTIVYHHTAGRQPLVHGRGQQLEWLQMEAAGGSFGLPYNFVVFPEPPHPIYYLNDVDLMWPHTYGWNHATAICALGNYEEWVPLRSMVTVMWRLADALATMWGQYVPEIQHRDVYATVCPGRFLSPMLKR